jgi:hypothetical protein
LGKAPIMSRVRKILLIVLAFIVALLVSYFVILIGFLSIWDMAGYGDQNGGVAMGVGFFFAPIGALIIGFIAAIWTAIKLSGKH